ncbi:MAG TPA: hypothetical protein VLT57_03090 [Bryobacteraceae bacterium]|nr:hypothetical protein [Bryobacteraceae bacterium]
MKKATLPRKELDAIAATRLGFGIGVTSLSCTQHQCRWIGSTLPIFGALRTPPLIYDV